MRIDYKEKKLLSEETTQSELEFMVEDTKLQLESAINATKRDLAKAKNVLSELKTSYPLPIQNLMEAKVEVESLEAGLKDLEALKEELGF